MFHISREMSTKKIMYVKDMLTYLNSLVHGNYPLGSSQHQTIFAYCRSVFYGLIFNWTKHIGKAR